MLRTLTIASLSLAVLAPANAETYKDPNGRFQMTIPAGWTSADIKDRRALTFVLGHDKTEAAPYIGVCLGLFLETPDTRGRSQDEINREVDGQITPDVWREAMKSAGSGSNSVQMQIETTGSRMQSGRSIHHVTYTASKPGDAEGFVMKGKMEMHFVPGAMHTTTCSTAQESFPLASADIETILTSYDAKGDTLVSGNERAPSVLTMYAKANYTGAAQVLSHDTANLAAAGWPTLSASLTVEGAEPWQICAGAEFRGTCRTMVGAQNGGFTIGSARRLSGKIGFANLATSGVRRVLQHPAMTKANGR
jgi:hypothetical protein